jgi:hypothetical protein
VTGDELVVVASFPDRFAADVAKSALEANGIDCLERSDDAGGMRPHLAFTSGVTLLVRAEDAFRAAQILKS